jgi:hypothetical protein
MPSAQYIDRTGIEVSALQLDDGRWSILEASGRTRTLDAAVFRQNYRQKFPRAADRQPEPTPPPAAAA